MLRGCLLFTLFLLLVPSALSLSLDISLGGLSPYKEYLVDYGAGDDNNTVLQGFITYPKRASSRSPLPAVILFHAFTGREDFDNEKARQIAKMGYVAFAADTYGKGVRGSTVDENFAVMGGLLEMRESRLRDRIMAAWNHVNTLAFVDKNKIASIGFCFGGLCSLDLARFDVGLKAAVSFHGTLTNYPGNNTSTRTHIQAHHGDADVHTTNEDAASFVVEMRERQADWSLSVYSDAEHAFTLPGVEDFGIPGASYNEKADKRSWAAMTSFLREILN